VLDVRRVAQFQCSIHRYDAECIRQKFKSTKIALKIKFVDIHNENFLVTPATDRHTCCNTPVKNLNTVKT